ncbi:MAG: phage virion morphogenesis protein [Treponema sp.]|jgi:phage virion morphogenesis protein|nr:phage virion morphogenesis protein [Treponema sp.]
MAGTGILKAKYDSDFQAIIDALSRASMPDLEEIANFAGGELAYISQKAFENEEDPVTGKRWEPLKRPRPDGSRDSILHPSGNHGHLKPSLNWQAFPDGSVVFGSNVVYARIHQKGGQAGRGRKALIPARPYMGVPSDFDRRILNDPAVLELLGIK